MLLLEVDHTELCKDVQRKLQNVVRPWKVWNTDLNAVLSCVHDWASLDRANALSGLGKKAATLLSHVSQDTILLAVIR